jgi:hypothetical protein
MNELQSVRREFFCFPQALKSGAEFTGAIGATPRTVDRAGYDYGELVIVVGAIAANMAEAELLESDDGENFAAIAGSDIKASILSTSDNTIHVVGVDLRRRKRFLQIKLKAGAGNTEAVAYIDLYRQGSGVQKFTAAERGLASFKLLT